MLKSVKGIIMIKKDKLVADLLKIKSLIKFEKNEDIPYSGISDNNIRLELNKLIDSSVDEFVSKVESGATDRDFQELIQKGLIRFDRFELDTDDRERVCLYYEELMDVINLESSGGIINKWMYGFEF